MECSRKYAGSCCATLTDKTRAVNEGCHSSAAAAVAAKFSAPGFSLESLLTLATNPWLGCDRAISISQSSCRHRAKIARARAPRIRRGQAARTNFMGLDIRGLYTKNQWVMSMGFSRPSWKTTWDFLLLFGISLQS
jgi:hypothetical protein